LSGLGKGSVTNETLGAQQNLWGKKAGNGHRTGKLVRGEGRVDLKKGKAIAGEGGGGGAPLEKEKSRGAKKEKKKKKEGGRRLLTTRGSQGERAQSGGKVGKGSMSEIETGGAAS